MENDRRITYKIPASLENVRLGKAWEGAISSVMAIYCFTAKLDTA
ncbi:hypothetical protein E2C01_101370 [Portunus trituberculatus]|uniref:Uncharacterized protein n=1 Tax=Portunus trituberculatus TaxID=210409 RepID=A0A5B7KJY1_PORTR|nr:hypothetical protein [Portunus trituberculatus]